MIISIDESLAKHGFTACDMKPGEALWVGPIPEGQHQHIRTYAYYERDRCRNQGVPIHVRLTGDYICFRHIKRFPTHKLSDLRQLDPGERVMLDPVPTPDAIEMGITTTRYLTSSVKVGRFRSYVEADGSLWVQRST